MANTIIDKMYRPGIQTVQGIAGAVQGVNGAGASGTGASVSTKPTTKPTTNTKPGTQGGSQQSANQNKGDKLDAQTLAAYQQSMNTGAQGGGYAPSDTVLTAYKLLQQAEAGKPGEYESRWDSLIWDTIDQITNREDFSYDINEDALYQMYKDQYVLQGQQAMMDTMGQAATLTGGYGNSYAQTAGQQAYQGYLQQLNDRVPELYQIALDQYNREGDELYELYGLYSGEDDRDYGRYRDEVADYYTDRDYYYNRYNNERDFDYGQYVDDRNFDYQKEQDALAYKQWQMEFDEDKRRYEEEREESKSGGGGGSGGGSSYRSGGDDEPAGDEEEDPGYSDDPAGDAKFNWITKSAMSQSEFNEKYDGTSTNYVTIKGKSYGFKTFAQYIDRYCQAYLVDGKTADMIYSELARK